MARPAGDIEREIAETRERLAADLDEFARRVDVRPRLRAALPSPAVIAAVAVIAATAFAVLRSRRPGS